MGLVDRLNEAVLRRLRPETPSKGGVELTRRVEEIVHLVALNSPVYPGDVMMLVGKLSDGRLLGTDESDGAWPQLLTALDRSGRTSQSSREWTLRLMADDVSVPIALIGDLAAVDLPR